MKPSKITSNRVSYLIDMDIENHSVNLRVCNDLSDGTVKEFNQSYNLDILPLDSVMSQICQLLLPRKN